MLGAILTLIIVCAGIAYFRAWVRSGIPAWRAASLMLGLLFAWVAAASPLASFDHRMLTAHMAQHLLLMTFAPPLIWMGEPMKLLWRVLPQIPSGRLGRLLGQPVFCWLSAAAVLVAWHVPALLRLGSQSPAWHLLEHATFFAAGLLFWWPVVQPWPSVSRWPRWSMLLYLFLATLPCDVLSGLLVFSDRVVYPMYLCTPQQSGLSVLDDQQCAGALMWTCVTLVFLVAGAVLSMQLLSHGRSSEKVVEAIRV